MEDTFDQSQVKVLDHHMQRHAVGILGGWDISNTANSKPDLAQSKPDLAHSKPDLAKSKPDLAKSKPDLAKSKADLDKAYTGPGQK